MLRQGHYQHRSCPSLPPQGFLSPASRGSLLTAALVMYLLLSVAAGYSAVWLWGLVNRSYEGWFKVGGQEGLLWCCLRCHCITGRSASCHRQ